MGELLLFQQRVDRGELFDDRLVGCEDKLPGKELNVRGELAVIVHRRVDVQIILEPDLVVFLPVSRGGMHAAGAGLQGDMGSGNQQ